MSNNAISPLMEDQTNYSYERVKAISSIAEIATCITSTSIEQAAMVSIKLSFEYEEKTASHSLTQVHSSTEYLLSNLRSLVRKTDVVFLLTHAPGFKELKGERSAGMTAPGSMRSSIATSLREFYFLLLGANVEGGEIVQLRLWEALLWRVHNIHERDLLRPRSMSIGHSAYPSPHEDIDEFIRAASQEILHLDCQPERPSRKDALRQPQQIQQNQIDEELPALARKLGIPYLSFLPSKLPRRVQELVDPRLAQELRCFPIGRERNMLTVAMLNPQDDTALKRLQQETGLRIFPVLTHPSALQTALEQLV